MSALQGYRVVELSHTPAAEYCGKLLSDFGAEVIKVERPGLGSPTRSMGPYGKGERDGETSGLFAWLNTGKRSVTLDLQSPEGLETLGRLLARADALVEDHAPGWLKEVGVDPAEFAEVYPRLVACSITPYGQDAPPERAHAEDLNVFHASPWGYHTPSGVGDALPPLKGAGRFQASYEAGLDAALCVVACLYRREETGRGQVIDISKQAVMASRMDYVLAQMVAGDMDVSAERDAFDLRGPSTIFACRDGFVYLWMSAPDQWAAFGKLIGDPDWMKPYPKDWLEKAPTPERVAEVRGHITEWLRDKDKVEIAAVAQNAGLMVVPVNNAADLPSSPQYQFRKYFAEVEHPVLGRAAYPTTPYRLSATPPAIRSAAPLLGEANGELASLAGSEGAAA